MTLADKILNAIDQMSNWNHNSQDWDEETYKFLYPVLEEVLKLEQELKEAKEIINETVCKY